MENKNVHFIITGEQGRGYTFVINKKTIRSIITSSLLVILILTAGTFAGIRYFGQSRTLLTENKALDQKLSATTRTLQTIRAEKNLLVARYEENILDLEHNREALLEGSISRLDRNKQGYPVRHRPHWY